MAGPRPQMAATVAVSLFGGGGVGLHMPAELSFEDWARAGRQLSRIVDSSAWWLGDWLVFGKSNYSDCYQLAIQRAGLRYQTLRNYAWVARRVPVSRRRAKLTFQHHAEIASLPIEEQNRLLDSTTRGCRSRGRPAVPGRAPTANAGSLAVRRGAPPRRRRGRRRFLRDRRRLAACHPPDRPHRLTTPTNQGAADRRQRSALDCALRVNSRSLEPADT